LAQEKSRVVFLTYHGTGHFNACFRLAKVLSSRYDVVFAGVPFFKNYVSAQGFQYYPLNTVPFGTGLEYWLNTVHKKKSLYFNTVVDRWSNKLCRMREEELTAMIQELKPDLVLLDAQQSTDFIVLYSLLVNHEIQFSLLHTMLPTMLRDEIPPLNSLILSTDQVDISKENAKIRWRNFKRKFVQKVKFILADDGFVINRSFRQRNIPWKFKGGETSFGFSVTNVPEIILAPQNFDFKEAKISSLQKYLGACIDRSRIEHADESYLSQHQEIFGKIKSQSRKLIYCGFGSIPSENEIQALTLLKKIIAATTNQPCLLLVSLKLDENKVKPFRNTNVFIFRHLPQLEILASADLFITHGGLNSIKESIAFGVPMLIYPVEFKTDHPGNSSRVVYHQLGLRGDIQKDSADDIREKMNSLLTDSRYKKNLNAFRLAEKEMDDEKILSIIHAIPEFKI
jgi:zeaxanthin glucosyltransferase